MDAVFTVAALALVPLRRDTSESVLGRTTLWEDEHVLGKDSDYLVIEGDAALDQRIRHRLITRPGSWALRPEYGAGLEELLNKLEQPGTIAEVERRVRDQLSYEAEVARVIQVNVRIENNADGRTMRVLVEYEAINANKGEVDLAFRRAG